MTGTLRSLSLFLLLIFSNCSAAQSVIRIVVPFAAMAALLKDPVILDRLAKQGVEPKALGVDEFNALLRADFQKMARVVKASGARVD